MNRYENLEQEAVDNGLIVDRIPFNSKRIKGLYCDGSIAIRQDIETTVERSCVLAEELGHYYTSVGNILDQTEVANRKQELRARAWAYNKKIGLIGIVNAYKQHCRNLYEVAEHLEVTEEFLKESLNYYRSKYGASAQIDNYVIFFEPNVCVLELI